jgi:hypothetical protein
VGSRSEYSFISPIETIYKYMYSTKRDRLKQKDLVEKPLEMKHTKFTLHLDYKCIGSYRALCSYNRNDILEEDEQPK